MAQTEKMDPLFGDEGTPGGGTTEKMPPIFGDDDDDSYRLSLTGTNQFTLSGGSYTIDGDDPDSYVGRGGEAVIYTGLKDSDGTRVAFKIYDTFNQQQMRQQKKLSEHLKEVFSDYKTCHLMPILDCGDAMLTDSEGQTKYFVDVMPYLPHGRVTLMSYEELRGELIPQILKAMCNLHDMGMIHRDIKPDNIFCITDGGGKVYLLNDFGATRQMTTGGANYTQKRTGTPGYTAPEVYSAYATSKSDYYSFGCTVATLYHGAHVYQTLIDHGEIGRLNQEMTGKGMPLGCPEEHKPLQELVNELTAPSPEQRAGKERVLEWLSDPKAFKSKAVFGDKRPLAFRSENKDFFSFTEIAEYLSQNWPLAREVLYRGTLEKSVSVDDAQLGVEIAKIEDGHRSPDKQDLGVALALHVLDPEGPVYWRGAVYRGAAEIAAVLNARPDDPDIGELLCSGFISQKLSLINEDPGVVSRVREIESVAVSGDESVALGLRMMRIAFSPTDEGKKVRGAGTIDELFEGVLRSRELYAAIADALSDLDFLAFVAVNGKKDGVLSLMKDPDVRSGDTERGEKLKNTITSFFLLAEDCMTDRKLLHETYLRYGPCSHEIWIAENIDLFVCHSRDAQRMQHEIRRFILPSVGEPLETIKSRIDVLSELEQGFLRLFQGNPFLANEHELNGKTGVTAASYKVYLADGLFGQPQMIGYLEMMFGRI